MFLHMFLVNLGCDCIISIMYLLHRVLFDRNLPSIQHVLPFYVHHLFVNKIKY